MSDELPETLVKYAMLLQPNSCTKLLAHATDSDDVKIFNKTSYLIEYSRRIRKSTGKAYKSTIKPK